MCKPIQTFAPTCKQALSLLLVMVCLTSVGCDTESTPQQTTSLQEEASLTQARDFDPALTANMRKLTDEYLQQIEVDFDEISNALSSLQSEVGDFLESPNADSMESARDAWLNAHSAYELTALHRYFANRTLPDAQGLQLFQLQYQISHWPILPGYIDYVGEYADSGIVHDTTVPLTASSLRSQHGLFEVSEATLGFHVIEFLLWGLNKSEDSPRPVSDFVASSTVSPAQVESGMTIADLPVNRRRELLSLVVDTLQADFQSLRVLWISNSSALRVQLLAMEGPQLISLLLSSMTDMLTEELLVRSLYPLLNGVYADSFQSPFSHATQNAVSAQLTGFERLLLESNTPDGVTLDALISSMSEDFADFFYQNFDASKECLVVLYSSLEEPADSAAALRAEFEVVECINLVTNMIEHLGQITAATR